MPSICFIVSSHSLYISYETVYILTKLVVVDGIPLSL